MISKGDQYFCPWMRALTSSRHITDHGNMHAAILSQHYKHRWQSFKSMTQALANKCSIMRILTRVSSICNFEQWTDLLYKRLSLYSHTKDYESLHCWCSSWKAHPQTRQRSHPRSYHCFIASLKVKKINFHRHRYSLCMHVLHEPRTHLTGYTSCTVMTIEPLLSAVSTVCVSYHTLVLCQPRPLSWALPTELCEQIWETPLVTFHTEKLCTPQNKQHSEWESWVLFRCASDVYFTTDSVYPDTTNEFESELTSIPPIASTYGSRCVCRLKHTEHKTTEDGTASSAHHRTSQLPYCASVT